MAPVQSAEIRAMANAPSVCRTLNSNIVTARFDSWVLAEWSSLRSLRGLPKDQLMKFRTALSVVGREHLRVLAVLLKPHVLREVIVRVNLAFIAREDQLR